MRWWAWQPFVGHYLSAHLAAATYHVGNDRWHYRGRLAGIGISYGFAWPLARRWNLSVEGGIGIYYMKDRKRRYGTPDTEPE